MNSRALSCQILLQVIQKKHALNFIINKYLSKTTDKALIQELCYGVLRWYPRLTHLADQFLKKPLDEEHVDIYILLIIGLYQIIYLRIPDHAAVHETVNAVKELKKPWASKLINAVLRNFLRDQEAYLKKLETIPTAKYAHPAWLLETIKQAWPQQWETIVAANNSAPPMILRVNLAKISLADYLALLHKNNLAAELIAHHPSAIVLTQATDVIELPGFKEGLVSVQDAAAQLVPELLNPAPNLRILDACAAPGGKTAHLLESAPKLQEVVALDLDPKRVILIKDNLYRLNLTATVKTADATQVQSWWDQKLFDRILIDAPCSATGVIRRHPDIKILRLASDISQLADTQSALLNSLWPLLKPQGILLYATCSILPEENAKVIEKFLSNHPDAQEQKFTLNWGQALKHGWQILPGESCLDGFYYCRLVKLP